MKRLMLLAMLVSGAAWAQSQWITVQNPQGQDPFTFWGDQYYCSPVWTPGEFCQQDLEVPWGYVGQVTVGAGASCFSDASPKFANGVIAYHCAVDVFLIAATNYHPQSYVTDIGLVTADGIDSKATGYFVIGYFLYPYWQSYMRADCYIDATVQEIQGDTPC
jgi:hypothetical protein